jgi:predicted HD phosphohydrolase
MMGFAEKVPHLVEGHVLAKRYLTAKEPSYYDKLSNDSKLTLVFQGGPMDAKEMAAVEKDALFELGAQLRRWDDLAKVESLEVPGFDHYIPMMWKAIVNPPRDAASCASDAFYVREGTKIVGVRH